MRSSPPTADLVALQQLRHELNTPLTVVRARAQLVQRWLARQHTLAERDRHYLEAALHQIVTASREMGAAIEALARIAPSAPATRRAWTAPAPVVAARAPSTVCASRPARPLASVRA